MPGRASAPVFEPDRAGQNFGSIFIPGLDISVQCDTDIFSILMQWVKRRELETPFDITKPNIVSVLISANYLGMNSLIGKIAFLTYS